MNVILKLLFTAISILTIVPSAHSAFRGDFFAAIDSEYSHSLRESSATQYDYISNRRLLDGAGVGFGFRAGVGSSLSLGITGTVGWRGHTPLQKNPTTGAECELRYETNYGLAGGYLSFGGGPTQLILEYYPYNHTWVTFSGEEAINPFRHKDDFRGIGWAGGFSFNLGSFRATLLFRHRQFDKAQIGGVVHEFPDDSYSQFHVQEFVLQIGGSKNK